MKILVFGKGFLGHNIIQTCENLDISAFATEHGNKNKELFVDVRDQKSIDKIITSIEPNVLINCVADLRLETARAERDAITGGGDEFESEKKEEEREDKIRETVNACRSKALKIEE